MPMETNIAPRYSSLADEATGLLYEGRQMLHILVTKMAMEMVATGGEAYVPPERCPCLAPVFPDLGATDKHMKIVNDSVGAISGCVSSVNTELLNLYKTLTESAGRAKEANYIYHPKADYCLSCEKIAKSKLAIERAVCNLSAEVARLHGAVQDVLGGYYLLAICPQDPSGDWAYRAPKTTPSAPSSPPEE